MDNTTDDFLKDIDSTDFFKETVAEVKPAASGVKTPEAVSVKPETKTPQVVTERVLEETTDSSPELMGSEFPEDYIRMVNRVKAQYKLLPSLNYDLIYREISNLSIKSSPTPTLEVLNDELHKVQAAKDRLAEIFINVIKCYNFKKRAVDILKDSWGKFGTEKNTEGRKGDATFRLSHFLMDFASTEALTKSCDHILKNLDSLQDNLSRRITIWQLLLKVREGRMALPDFDFGKETDSQKIDAIFADDGKGDKKDDEDGGVKLREF